MMKRNHSNKMRVGLNDDGLALFKDIMQNKRNKENKVFITYFLFASTSCLFCHHSSSHKSSIWTLPIYLSIVRTFNAVVFQVQ